MYSLRHVTNLELFLVIGSTINNLHQYRKRFYNSSNAIVAAVFAYTDPQDLEPGQTAPFKIIVDTPTANEITTTSLNIGSQQYSSVTQN